MHVHSPPHLLRSADGTDVTDQPIRMRVRGSSSAAEYAKKSFSLDPVNQIDNLGTADTTDIPFLGMIASWPLLAMIKAAIDTWRTLLAA
jgi:hypothetical protein